MAGVQGRLWRNRSELAWSTWPNSPTHSEVRGSPHSGYDLVMPTLLDVVHVLEEYQGRYEALDAFADDIDELRPPYLAPNVQVVPNMPRPTAEVWVGGRRLGIELFGPEGIARFRLLPEAPPPQNPVGIAAAL